MDPSYSSKSRRIFFTGRTSEKFSCWFLFLFSFFVFLPKFLVLGPIRPVPIVPGNFWLFEQLSEVLVAIFCPSEQFLSLEHISSTKESTIS